MQEGGLTCRTDRRGSGELGGTMVRRVRTVASLAMVAGLGLTVLTVPAARAADSPTFRDCSFVGGFDPDFVQLFNTSPDATVTPGQTSVRLLASESSDPGDSNGVVSFTASVTSSGIPAQKASGKATGRVVLTLPLLGAGVGRSYTIRWSAVFDTGNHSCPGTTLPTTTSGTPFSVRVVTS